MILEGLLIVLFIVYIVLLFYPKTAVQCENYLTSKYKDIADKYGNSNESYLTFKLPQYSGEEFSSFNVDESDEINVESEGINYDFAPDFMHYKSIDPEIPTNILNQTASVISTDANNYIRNSTRHDAKLLDQLESSIPHTYDLKVESFTSPELVYLDDALRIEGEVLHRKPQYNEFMKPARDSPDKSNENYEFDRYLNQGKFSKFVIPNKVFLSPYNFTSDEDSNYYKYTLVSDDD